MSGNVRTWCKYFIVAVVMAALPTAAFAEGPTTREYPYIYKSTRAMGMGGAYTAVGGRVDSLFYNPAGLQNIPRDKGWEVNLLSVSGEYGKQSKNFLDDMLDALDQDKHPTDSDRLKAVNDVLAKYRGKNLHIRVSDFTSVGKSYDRWAFGVGGIGNGRVDAVSHQGFGSDGILEVNADATYGAVGGFSLGFAENLIGGLSVKALHRESLVHNFSAREIVDNQDDLGNYIKDDLRRSGDAVAFDAGLIWKFAPESPLKPSLGFSVMNIGDLDFGAAGKMPQTVNLGVAVNPEISWSRSLVVAADYIDVLNGFKQDKDLAKRLRFGAEVGIFDIWPAELNLRAGLYNNAPTFGFDLRLLVMTISYAMYSEEVGAYAGQDRDTRHLLTLNLGW